MTSKSQPVKRVPLSMRRRRQFLIGIHGASGWSWLWYSDRNLAERDAAQLRAAGTAAEVRNVKEDERGANALRWQLVEEYRRLQGRNSARVVAA